MSLAIDPWADGPLEQDPPAQPDLTPDEWVAIRDEIREYTFGDPSLLPDCLVEAVKVLGDIGASNTPNPARAATQCLRAMSYRARNGCWPHEPQEPAWSLNPEPRPFEHTLSDDVVPGDLG